MSDIVKLAPLETINNSELVDYTIPNTSITKPVLEILNTTENNIYVYAWQFDTVKTIDIIEQIYKHLGINKTKTNVEAITEYVAYLKQQHIPIIESIQNTEAVAYVVTTGVPKSILENISATETVIKSLISTKQSIETTNLTETVDYFVNTSPVSKNPLTEVTSLAELPVKVLQHKFKSLQEQESLLEIVETTINHFPNINEAINLSELVDYFINSSVFVQHSQRISRIREAVNKTIVSYIKARIEYFGIIDTGMPKPQTLIAMPTASTHAYTLTKYQKEFLTHTYTTAVSNETLNTIQVALSSSNPTISILYTHNQLRLYPGNIYCSFGLIAKDIAQDFIIKSGYLQDLIVTAINIPNYLGGSITLNVGDIIPALSDVTFVLTLFLDKGAVVLDNANFSIELNSSIIIPIYVSATRQTGIVNSFDPDYKTYKSTLQYSTKTFRTMVGVEKRRALLMTPKKGVEYTRTFHTSAAYEQAKSSLEQNLYKLNYQPLWGSAVHPTTTDVGKGIPYINNKYAFKIGDYLCVWTSHLDYKVVKITNITDVTILVNITVSWTTDDFIIPLIKVMAETSTSATYTHNLDQTIKYKFRTLT